MAVVDTKDTGLDIEILNSGVKEHTSKDWSPTILMRYEEPLQMEGFDSSDQSVNGWISLIKEEIYSIPLVEDIFIGIEDTDVDVWVVIPHRDIAVLNQIVEREWELLKVLVSGENPPFLVDFHIIYRGGRSIEDLAPTMTFRLPR